MERREPGALVRGADILCVAAQQGLDIGEVVAPGSVQERHAKTRLAGAAVVAAASPPVYSECWLRVIACVPRGFVGGCGRGVHGSMYVWVWLCGYVAVFMQQSLLHRC